VLDRCGTGRYEDVPMSDEEVLHGGVANAGAEVRVGDHVLRPSNPHSKSIHRFLGALRSAGFDGASVPVGIDTDGRERLGFIPGDVATPPYPAWAQTDAALGSIARLIRRLHDASVGLDLGATTWSDEMADPSGGEVMCHNDVCLENVVIRHGEAIALLDRDQPRHAHGLFVGLDRTGRRVRSTAGPGGVQVATKGRGRRVVDDSDQGDRHCGIEERSRRRAGVRAEGPLAQLGNHIVGRHRPISGVGGLV